MTDLFDYIRLSKRAADLIYRYGDACTVKNYVDTPNPSPFDPPTRTETNWPTRGVFLKYKDSEIDGTLVRQGDQRVLLAGWGNQTPVKGQGRIVRGGEDWAIIEVSILRPDPVTMLYNVQVRR